MIIFPPLNELAKQRRKKSARIDIIRYIIVMELTALQYIYL